MDASSRRRWIRAALIVGVVYLLVGRVFAWPTEHVQAWRFAAWVASGVAYAAHIVYEHARLRSSTRAMALHVALAVALGAFGLALAGIAHSISLGSPIGPRWMLALVAWPAFTAVPAFLGALVAGAILGRVRRRTDLD